MSHHSSQMFFSCCFSFFSMILLVGSFVGNDARNITGRQHNGRSPAQFIIYRYDQDVIRARKVNYQIHPMILARRSLREMTGQPLEKNVLMSLFEAARWAPSYYNTQSWRFVYARRETPKFEQYLEALWPGNRRWAKDAAVLIVLLSSRYQLRNGNKKPVDSHSFDTGAAWMAMALEGTARGLVMHAMTGFDKAILAKAIELPNEDDYSIEAVVAIGHRAFPASNNEKISQRNDLSKYISEDIFNFRLTPTSRK